MDQRSVGRLIVSAAKKESWVGNSACRLRAAQEKRSFGGLTDDLFKTD